MNILPHRSIVRRVIESIRSGDMVLVPADQRGDDSRPIWIEFFGRRVPANGVLATFAAESGAYVFPVMSRRTSDGRYLCEF